MGGFREGVALAPYTTWRVGGPAEVLIEPSGEADLRHVLGVCRAAGVPLTVLGNGSNVLVPDEGVAGVVLRTVGALRAVTLHGDVLTAASGVLDRDLALFAEQHGIAGFEFLADIPGSVGGAAVMNAANNDGEFAAGVLSVRWLDDAGDIHETARAAAGYGYRQSRFRAPGHWLTAVQFLTAERDAPERIRERRVRLAAVRRAKFPLEWPNCGSVFKRPPGDFAGRLIEAAGCRGLRRGQAQVSPRHCGFVINLGGATARDIRALVADVQRRVLETQGVRLEREVVFLAPGGGEWPAADAADLADVPT